MRKKFLMLVASMAFAFSFNMTAYAQPQLMPINTLFDAEYYAQANPDVVATLGTDPLRLYLHYVQYGKAKGRTPLSNSEGQTTTIKHVPKDFDAAFYAQTYPDVAAELGTDPSVLYQHYIQFGKAEGRIGKPNVEVQPEKRVFEIVNEERKKAGCSPLRWDDTIAKATAIRADEVAKVYSHTRPDGKSCFTALENLGIKNVYMGENIAAGYRSPESVMNAWMNSPGHRKNILGSQFTRMAVGYTVNEKGSPSWVQLFAS